MAYPKIRSGCAMKSVIRSNMLRGSRTKVGKVTLDRSIPTLQEIRSLKVKSGWLWDGTDLNCDIREEMIDPSSSSLKSTWGISA